MQLRWKKNDRETGLAAVGAAPRGSKLHDGEKDYASVSPIGGGWRGPVRGWYWVAGWDSDVPYMNTSSDPCASEDEAKKAAREYVMTHLAPNDKA